MQTYAAAVEATIAVSVSVVNWVLLWISKRASLVLEGLFVQ
jgi:hypothetical protein